MTAPLSTLDLALGPDRSLAVLQEDIAGRLAADEVLADIRVLTERKGDLSSDIDSALAVVDGKFGRCGACIIVTPCSGLIEFPNLPDPEIQAEITIRILEDPTFNMGDSGTGKDALTLARRVSRVLHHYQPNGIAGIVVADSPHIVPVFDPKAPVCYEVNFSAVEGPLQRVPKVTAPTIFPDRGEATAAAPITVSIACETPGAAIYYTLDGSHPAPLNDQARQVNGTIQIRRSGLLRAVAYAPDHIASDCRAAVFD